MKLVERHVITKSHYLWSACDHKAFLSKNLFNLANYYYRQHFFENKKKLNFNELYHQVSKSDDYQALTTKVSKQIIRRLDSAWSSYFAALKAINTFDNKQRSYLQSQLKTNHNRCNSNRLKKLTHKRNGRVKNYLHTASKRVIDWCINHEIGTLIIGQNQTEKKRNKIRKKEQSTICEYPSL